LSPSVTAKDGDAEGGAPVSLIDMSATGILLVSSRHCDIPEIVIHGETGLLSDERDVDGIVENIKWLVNNTDKWADLSSNARKRIETEFNAAEQSAKLARIYSRVINDI
jgi:colanic acid/amylovoran biosynthesis glycosyltransferase